MLVEASVGAGAAKTKVPRFARDDNSLGMTNSFRDDKVVPDEQFGSG
jgi:hypothetical protein